MTNEKNFTMQTLVQICAKTAQTKCMMLRLLLNIAPDIFYIIRNGKNIVVVFILKSLSTDDMGRSHLDVSNSSSIRGEFLKMIVGRPCSDTGAALNTDYCSQDIGQGWTL